MMNFFIKKSWVWIEFCEKNEKSNDIGENVWLIKSMIIIQRLVYDDGKSLRVILMRINLGIMIGSYRNTMKLSKV